MRTLALLILAAGGLPAQSFPGIALGGLNYYNTENSNTNAFSNQMADFDPVHKQVLFYPYGQVSGTNTVGGTPVALGSEGILMVYLPGGPPAAGGGAPFTNPANHHWFDLTSLVSTYAWNFGGGNFDGNLTANTYDIHSGATVNPTYAYLPGGPRSAPVAGSDPSKTAQGEITVQVNLADIYTAASTSSTPISGTFNYIDERTLTVAQGPTQTGTAAIPYAGGFSGIWANGCEYLIPTVDSVTGFADGLLLRYCPALGPFNSKTSWQYFNMNTIPGGSGDPQLGGMQSAGFIYPYLYLVPFFNGYTAASGTVNTTGTSATSVSGSTFSSAWVGLKMHLTTSAGAQVGNYLITAVSGSTVTFSSSVGTYTGLNFGMTAPSSKLVRLDTSCGGGPTAGTSAGFFSASCYATVDLSTLTTMATGSTAGVISQFNGFTGAVVSNNGTKLTLVPWGVRNTQTTNSVAIQYDQTCASGLASGTCWKFIDLTTITNGVPQSPSGISAAGYQNGWLDNAGYMWFVPTHNFNDTTAPPAIPPFVVYNTALPFDAASSWTTYANHGYPTGKSVWLTGCAYDPVSNTAWASAYGVPLTANTIEPPYNMELHEQSASTSNYTISIKGGISINGGIVIQ